MNSEDEFRREVIDVGSRAGHASHIESHQTSAGIPDLCIFWAGSDIWLELKIIKNGQIRMRPTQRRWHLDRAEYGGRSWVLTYDPATGDILVTDGQVAATLAASEAAWRAVSGVSNMGYLPHTLSQLSREQRNALHGKGSGTGTGGTSDGTGPVEASESVRSPYRHGAPQGARSTGSAFCSCIRCLVGDSRYSHSSGPGGNHAGSAQAGP